MRIAVTRPAEDAADLAGQLAAAGHRPLMAPVLEIELLPAAAPRLDGLGGLVATSRNGLRALSTGEAPLALRQLPIHVVGGATAALARSLGFEHVTDGGGTARDLAEAIAAEYTPETGALLYLRGEDIAYDLAGHLQRHAIAVREVITYRSHRVAAWPSEVVAAFRERAVDGAILLSPRTAAAYASLIGRHHLAASAASMPHFCLSTKVAAVLSTSWPDTAMPMMLIADLPQIDRILTLVNLEAAAADVDRRSSGSTTC